MKESVIISTLAADFCNMLMTGQTQWQVNLITRVWKKVFMGTIGFSSRLVWIQEEETIKILRDSDNDEMVD